MERLRLDQLLLKRGFFDSRSRAQWAIRQGLVQVNGRALLKTGERVDAQCRLEVQDHPALRFVGFGGMKLFTALEAFNVSVKDLWAMDIGASTGGFTDCLLQMGARRVLAVDVGTGQLHPKLRRDPRVISLEGTDIRGLQYPYIASLITVDVSFISITQILPDVMRFVDQDGTVILLIKPQFEQDKKMRFRGGVIRNFELVLEAVDKVTRSAESCGLYVKEVTLAPVEEEKNVEVLALFHLYKPAFRMRVIHQLREYYDPSTPRLEAIPYSPEDMR